ncbi:MAG: ferrochelatase [Deltaproteobacteria bacterium]|nr:ferrochelatase [Deltaproteobacteria bacterium]
MKKIGLLLINLGSPDAPTPAAVGRYLREFLMDEFVIDLPKPLRWLLVNLLIVPRRRYASAKLYQNVWTADGSPLLAYTRKLAAGLGETLPEQFVIEIGMRYGQPSIANALAQLCAAGAERLVALPLYPQYAESSYETAARAVRAAALEQGCSDQLELLPPFYDQPGFINACVTRLREYLAQEQPEHFIFSYHSLPVRHIKRLDTAGQHCLQRADCCAQITAANQNCYRAHCVQTTQAIVRELNLSPDNYSLAFQSRLGRQEWLGPQTNDVLCDLAQRGIKRVAVSCPSFTADCLETLEEIGLRAHAVFLRAGGEALTLVPALNEHPIWVAALADWIKAALKPDSQPLAQSLGAP